MSKEDQLLANKNSEFNWTREETLFLLSICKNYPIIYHHKHPDFRNTDKRRLTFFKIAKELQTFKPKVNVESIKRKIHVLKGQIFMERKRKADWLKNKNQLKIVTQSYKPKLWCYHDAIFLRQYEEEKSNLVESTSSTNTQELSQNEQEIIKIEIDDASDDDVDQVMVTNEFLKNDNEEFLQISETPTYDVTRDDDDDDEDDDDQQHKCDKSQSTTNLATLPTNAMTLSKEDAFCNYLSTELKTFIFEESFDRIRIEIFTLIANLKAKEREKLKYKEFQNHNS